MYHPTRGGVRGGRDQFSWENVKTDKDRECYLGHSLMAPVGRWQEGKDLHWYAKEGQKDQKANKEFLKAREIEEQALMAALGYKVVKKEKEKESDLESKIEKEQEEYEKKKKSNKSEESTHGPQYFEFDDKKALDKILLKLLDKYGKKELVNALGGHEKEKQKHKKKDKKSKKSKRKNTDKKHRSDSSESDSSESSEDEKSSKKRKQDSSHKSINKKHKKESKSTSGSSSDSD